MGSRGGSSTSDEGGAMAAIKLEKILREVAGPLMGSRIVWSLPKCEVW
jgi:hypothetical protein